MSITKVLCKNDTKENRFNMVRIWLVKNVRCHKFRRHKVIDHADEDSTNEEATTRIHDILTRKFPVACDRHYTVTAVTHNPAVLRHCEI